MTVSRGSDAALADCVAEEIESCLAKDVLLMDNHQTILHQYLEDLPKMGSMLFLVVKCNEYIIQKDKCRDASQDVIHQPLKHLPSIGETQWHLQEFKQAKRDDFHHLVDILRCHWYLVITFSMVNPGEDSASIQVGVKILDTMDRIAAIGCRGI